MMIRSRLVLTAFASLFALPPVASATDCWTIVPDTVFTDPGGPDFLWLRNRLSAATLFPYHYMPDLFATPGDDDRFYFHGLYGRGVPTAELYKEQVQLHLSHGLGVWEEVGVTRTSPGGDAGFYLEGESRLGPGSHHLKAWVPGDDSEANAFAWVWRPGMKAIVTDIDGTCTLDDLQEYLDIIYEIGPFDYVPEEKPGAPELMQYWASRNVAVVYLTARPLYLKEITRQWLAEKGFPAGPLILYGAGGGVLPPIGPGATVDYKAGRIDDLEERIGVRFLAAYGNSDTDRDAFCRALDIPPERFFLIDCALCAPLPDCRNSVVEDDWFGHLADLEARGIPELPQPCD